MQRHIYLALLICASAFCVPACASGDNAKTEPNGYSMTMMRRPFGKMTYYFSPLGAKAISPIVNMIVHPDNSITIYANNKYRQYKAAQAINQIMFGYRHSDQEWDAKFKPWQMKEQVTIKGITAVHFSQEMINPPAQPSQNKTSTFTRNMYIAPLSNFKFKGAATMATPIVKEFNPHLPMEGIPIKETTDWEIYKNKKLVKSDVQVSLEPLEWGRITMTAADLKLPPNYTKATSDVELMYGGMGSISP